MPAVPSAREITLLRLVAQRLVRASEGAPVTAAGVVRWLTAVQAQDYPGAVTSVALRTTAGDRAGVEAALDAGDVVRTWPMRGTLHLIPAEDLPWLLPLTAARPAASAARRRTELGLEPDTLERAREAAEATLGGGRRLRREELLAAWQEAGLPGAGPHGYHLIGYLAMTGVLCFGPVTGPGGEQQLVLVEEWIRRPRRPERDEALGELATRYFRGHGPATSADFARWTGLPAADVRTALALARPALATLTYRDTEHLLDPRTPELLRACRRRAGGTFLLPGFDELILGYGDRRAMVPPEYADQLVPGGNGVFRPTLVHKGAVIGTWRPIRRRSGRTIDATPFREFPDPVAAAIPRLFQRLP